MDKKSKNRKRSRDTSRVLIFNMDMNMVNMNTQLAATTSLQFGVEIELLLEGRKKAFSSWKALASDVSKRLSSVGIANHVHDDAKGLATYEAWAIVREVTVPNQPAKGLCMFAFVSFFLS